MPIYKTGKKNKDGITQYRVTYNYTDKSGKYRQKSKMVFGLDVAKTTELILMKEVSGTAAPGKMTVRELFEEYTKSKLHEVRESSLEKSKRTLESHVMPHLENTRLDKLTTAVLQDWKNKISDLDLKVITKKNIYKEFRTMLNYAVKLDYLESNPLLKVGNFKDAYSFEDEIPEEKIQYYTPEEFKKFIFAAAKHNSTVRDYGYYAFFNIAFYTGMRKGEINALTWSNLDMDNAIIYVKTSVTQKLKGKSTFFTPPKNISSVRKLKLPEPLMVILRTQKKIQQKNLPNWNEDFFVCGGPTCLSDTSIENRNILYAKEAELPHLRIHDFRHTHATVLINNNISIQEVSRRLGHSDVNITWKIYAHLYPQEEDKAISVLESL